MRVVVFRRVTLATQHPNPAPFPTRLTAIYPVHGILRIRILEWAAFPVSRGSSQPRDRILVFHVAGGFFTSLATGQS